MGWFRRTSEVDDVQQAPLTGWEITTSTADNGAYTLRGSVYGHKDQGEADVIRYVDAIASGLRSAGYVVEVTLVRESREAGR